MRTRGMRAVLATSLMWMAAVALKAQVVVIISAQNPISRLEPSQISEIFLGQTKTFFTGGMAVPLDQPEGSAIRKTFYEKLTGKNPAQLKAYWSRLTFSGTAQPPASLANDQAVVKEVASNPKYIGYVDKSAVNPSVKIVMAL